MKAGEFRLIQTGQSAAVGAGHMRAINGGTTSSGPVFGALDHVIQPEISGNTLA